MKIKRISTILLIALTYISNTWAAVNKGEQLFNDGWKFTLSDKPEYSFSNYKVGKEWRSVELPHDWSVELTHTGDLTKADGATGYLPGGIGWYNRSFEKPISDNQKCYIVFDGVYNNSEYWINGKKLGDHPYGYSPFYYDLTEYLKPKGQTNELMVRVDHSRFADSRWYTGSGIYRNVKLLITDKLHIPIWGTYLCTPFVSKERASVSLDIELRNDYSANKKGVILTDILDPQGKRVASATTRFDINGNKQQTLSQQIEVSSPALWGTDAPNLYKAQSKLIVDGETKEVRTTRFGFRTIRFDAKKGFFLNGKNMKIKGVCLHHDAGLVGSAVPKAVWERRLRTLQSGGCNAIRSAHNPCSEEFLDLCDELGILVQQEFFDEWDNPKDKRKNAQEQIIDYPTRGYDRHFQVWGEKDLKNVMKRDRNHACIFQWSIGNEIEWTYKGNREATGFFGADASGGYFWSQPPYSPERIRSEWKKQPKETYDIGKTAHKLANWVREMDTTRPVVANCILPSASYETGYIDALDVAGFSYRRVMYDYGYKHYPDKPMMGTENLGQWHEWKAVLERDFISGIFIWTGIDYMGERGGKRLNYPEKSTVSGLLDLAGFEKPSFHMMKSLWIDSPFIAIYSQTKEKSAYKENAEGKFIDANPKKPWTKRLWVWDSVNPHWNYNAGEKVIVEIYSNCEEVELFQNKKSLGKKKLADFEDHIYKWSVDFSKGTLSAKGITKSGAKGEASITTAGDPASISLTADKKQMGINKTDVVHIVAQLMDKKGNPIRFLDKTVEFSVEGDCKLLGVDNGHTANTMPFQANKVKTSQGRCLLIIQAKDKAADIKITAKADNLSSNSLNIKVQ